MKAVFVLLFAAASLAAQDEVKPKIPSIVLVPGLQAPAVIQAPGFFQLRPLELNIHDFNGVRPQKRLMVMRSLPPKVCAIPLRKFVPSGTYPMHVVKPPAEAIPMPEAPPLAPACDEAGR